MSAAGAVGFGAGYVVAQVGLFGWPGFGAAPVEHGLVWVALAGVMIGVVESWWGGRWWARWLWRGAAALVGAWLMVRLKALNGVWSEGETLGAVAGLGAGTLAFWTLSAGLCARIETGKEGGDRGSGGGAFVLALIAGLGAALVVLDGQTLVVAQFGGALALGLLVWSLGGFFARGVRVVPGGVGVVGLLLPLIWVDAWMWSQMRWWVVVALCASPGLGFAGDLPWVRGWRGRLRLLVRVGAVALPLMVLVGWEVKRALEEEATKAMLGY